MSSEDKATPGDFKSQTLEKYELKQVLDAAEAEFKREAKMREAERVATVLWIAHTYVYQAFKMTPRLFVTSDGPNSGKSTVLKLVADLAAGGQKLERCTLAFLGRVKQGCAAYTAVLDQQDHQLSKQQPGVGTMLDLLCAGTERGAKIGLTAETVSRGAKTHQAQSLDLFYPIAIGKIGGLANEALRSRVITIEQLPASSVDAEALWHNSRGAADPAVRDKLAKALEGRGPELAATRPEMPEGFINRRRDKWHAPFAIADAAGGDWPARARAAAMELEADELEADFKHLELLREVAVIAAAGLHEALLSEEIREWLPDGTPGKSSAKALASLLKLVELKPQRMRRDGVQKRGYLVADIMAAARDWLPAEAA